MDLLCHPVFLCKSLWIYIYLMGWTEPSEFYRHDDQPVQGPQQLPTLLFPPARGTSGWKALVNENAGALASNSWLIGCDFSKKYGKFHWFHPIFPSLCWNNTAGNISCGLMFSGRLCHTPPPGQWCCVLVNPGFSMMLHVNAAWC